MHWPAWPEIAYFWCCCCQNIQHIAHQCNLQHKRYPTGPLKISQIQIWFLFQSLSSTSMRRPYFQRFHLCIVKLWSRKGLIWYLSWHLWSDRPRGWTQLRAWEGGGGYGWLCTLGTGSGQGEESQLTPCDQAILSPASSSPRALPGHVTPTHALFKYCVGELLWQLTKEF